LSLRSSNTRLTICRYYCYENKSQLFDVALIQLITFGLSLLLAIFVAIPLSLMSLMNFSRPHETTMMPVVEEQNLVKLWVGVTIRMTMGFGVA